MNDKIAVGEAGKDFQKLARTVLETPEPAAKKAAAKVKETADKVGRTAETARVAMTCSLWNSQGCCTGLWTSAIAGSSTRNLPAHRMDILPGSSSMHRRVNEWH